MRLLAGHPDADLRLLTANAQAGRAMAEVYPHLGGLDLPALIKAEDADWSQVDLVFCGLPHGTTQELIAALPGTVNVIDLSADFRLRDVDSYAQWYGHEHRAPALQAQAVYGLTEHYREAVRPARLVACPGCYPTAVLLALLPLVGAGAVVAEDIVIDAKSGATGAGRSLKQELLFGEVAESLRPYGIARHRHAPEIEQELSAVAGRALLVNFTPHLVPMNRGELVTCYLRLAEGTSAEDLRALLAERYAGEPFVRVLAEGVIPATRDVRGSNSCLIGVYADRVPGRAVVVAVIDNLVKGSSGQAIQNMNLMCGLPETRGLLQQPLSP